MSDTVQVQPRGPRGPRGLINRPQIDGPFIQFQDEDGGYDDPTLRYNGLGPEGPAGNAQFFATRAIAAASAISAGVQYLTTAGYTTSGDGGGALYMRSGSLVTGGFQTADGAFWQLATAEHARGLDARKTGAKLDGVTDDSAAFLAAATVAGAGGKVFLPRGTLLLTPVTSGAFLNVPSGLSIIGAGKDATTIKLAAGTLSPTGQSLFTIAGTGTVLSGFTIDGGAHTSDLQALIFGVGATRLKLIDLRLINFAGGLASIYLQDCVLARAYDVEIDAFTGSYGAQIARGHAMILTQVVKADTGHCLEAIHVRGGAFGIGLVRQQKTTLANFLIEDVPGTGLDAGDGINLDNSSYCAISNGVIFGRHDGGLVMYTSTPSAFPENNAISNLTVTYCSLDGLYISAGRNNQFSGIVTINNNQHAATPRAGININVDSASVTTNNSFVGVTATDTQGPKTQSYGIAVGSGVTNTFVFDAALAGNLTADYVDIAVNTIITEVFGAWQKSNNGYLVPKGGSFLSVDGAGNPRSILGVSDSGAADATFVQSAGGGVALLSAAGAVLMTLSDAGVLAVLNGTLKNVTFGANDSGGSGFKVLRIPN